MKKVGIFILFFILAIHLGVLINQNLRSFITSFRPLDYKKVFSISQYSVPGSKNIIPDEVVFAYASWEIMKGENPILINGEAAPFGKYLIGISERYLNNEKVISLIFNILSLSALFYLSFLIFKSFFWSLLLITIFSFEKLFIAQMVYAPSLDNIQLFFILLSFIFYILSFKKPLFLISAFLTLGILMSVKFWLPGVLIFLIWIINSVLSKNYERTIKLILSSPFALLSMLIIFIPVFLQGEQLRRFFGYQKYLFEFYRQKLDFNPLGFWDLILFNRWHISSDSPIQKASDWQITWPILTMLTLVFILLIFNKRIFLKTLKVPVGVIVIWFFIYIFFLSFGTILPRYILPVLPAFYILGLYSLRVILTGKYS